MKEKEKTGLDLTEGGIWGRMLRFSFPMFLGNIFQQTYNFADSAIVGQFVGNDALAAVGSSASIIMMILSIFFGTSIGAGVVISRSYGAKDWKGVERGVHTMAAFGIIGGVLFTIIGEILTPHILTWIGTPKSVMAQSIVYFRIFFAGTLFSALYNIGGGILRAVGDSERPLYYLIASCLINVGMDFLFVAVFHWGIAGAAWATVIAQFISCMMVTVCLMTTDGVYRISVSKLKLHREELKDIIAIGLPSGLQNSIVSMSNVVVQSSINTFGALALAGYGSYNKIDGFAMMPASAFAMATTTFVSSNIGAGKYDRVRKGARAGLLLNFLTAIVIGLFLAKNAPWILTIFSDDPEIIGYGALQAATIAPFYFLCAGSHAMVGLLRGTGRSTFPMIIIVLFWCGLRMTWITFVARPIHIINYVYYAYPLTWTCSFTVLGIYCILVMRKYADKEAKTG